MSYGSHTPSLPSSLSRSNSSTVLSTMHHVSPSTTNSALTNYESPSTSTSMVRKRTLQDMVAVPPSPFTFDNSQYSSGSSPMSSLPSFEFDNPSALGTSSPYSNDSTADSSPMILNRSNSSVSSLGSYGVKDSEEEEEEEEEPIRETRAPEMKRRRTSDSVLLTPTKGDKRGNGKDGLDVWPEDVETAFHEALAIIPKLGRKKVMVNGKPCGRNELIAHYVRRKTGKIRSRKQVSSHIQVLKNMKKHDAVFMALVADPTTEGEDSFTPEAAFAFFGRQLPSLAPEAGASLMASYSDGEGLLSPYTPSSHPRTQQRSLSAGSISPVAFSRSNLHTPTAVSQPMSATSSLTTAMKDMHFPLPSHRRSSASPCPIAPSAFHIWYDDKSRSGTVHDFVQLDNDSLSGPFKNVNFDELPLADVRFPTLAAMHDYLPCKFLHIKINFDIPTQDHQVDPYQLRTQLTLTSIQNLNLTCVTSIYSHGTQVLSLEEKLAHPIRLNPSTGSSSNGSSPDSSCSPPTPTDGMGHQYSYNAPFASDFWSMFLQGEFFEEAKPVTPSFCKTGFCKTGRELAEFSDAIKGLSVVQEFVVQSEGQSVPLVSGNDISPGSALGDVVLVLTYDFECKASSSTGFASLSKLSVRKPIKEATRMQPSLLSTNRSTPIHSFPSNYSVASSPVFVSESHSSSPDIIRPRPTHSSKPSLTLHIPPPPSFSSSNSASHISSSPVFNNNNITPSAAGPITPWPLIMQTPNAPPPIHTGNTSPNSRDRLGLIWARTSNEWEITSPALMGAFHQQQQQQQQQHEPLHHQHQHHHHQLLHPQHSQDGRFEPHSSSRAYTEALAAGTPLSSPYPSGSGNGLASSFIPTFVHPAHNLPSPYIKTEFEESSIPPSTVRSKFSILEAGGDEQRYSTRLEPSYDYFHSNSRYTN